MGQRVKALAAEAYNLSSIPRNHIKIEETQLHRGRLCPPHACYDM